MDLYESVLAIVEVVDVATGPPHEHALDQLASRITVDLANLGRRAQHFECLLELVDEEFLGVTMFAPPFVLRFNRRWASASRTIFTTRPVLLQVLPGIRASTSLGVVQRTVERRVQLRPFLGRQLVIDHDDLDLSSVGQVSGLVDDLQRERRPRFDPGAGHRLYRRCQ